MDPKYEQICKELKEEFPSFRVVPKETSRLMKLAYYGLLMFLWNDVFMTRFTTVFRTVVYMPMNMIGASAGYRVLRHERVHMRDSKGWRFLYYGPSYILLPIGPSGRAYWELRGYKESMRTYMDEFGSIPDSAIEFWAECFYGSKYLWMWPFKNHIRGILYRYRDELTNGKRP